MDCAEAPVARQFRDEVAAGFDVTYLGIVGDQAHQTRRSSHNCAPMQEGPIDGVAYHPGHAHAYDCRPATSEIGFALVTATLADPFGRVRYVLYADHGWYPDGTFEDISDNPTWDLDHDTFHVSFLPGTTFDTRPFDLEVIDVKQIIELLRDLLKAARAIRDAQHRARLTQLAQGRVLRQLAAGQRPDPARLSELDADLAMTAAELTNPDRKD